MFKLLKYGLSVLLILLITSNGHAHTRSQSFSTWTINEDSITLSISILAREITRLAADKSVDVTLALDDIFSIHIKDRISLTTDSKPCNPDQTFISLPARKGYVKLEAQFNCTVVDQIEIQYDGMFDLVSSHLHYAHIKPISGITHELVFSDANRKQSFSITQGEQDFWSTSFNYIILGIEHILIGIDHLVFLLALLLLCRSFKHLLILITGFTLGHSLTLILSVLGWIQPNMIIVEAMIGFSIVLVSLELLQSKDQQPLALAMIAVFTVLVLLKLILSIGLPILSLLGLAILSLGYLTLSRQSTSNEQSYPWVQFLLTLAFGFIHGFGFAEVLREIGLPGTQLGIALLSFNIGVELGQVLAILVVSPLLFYIANKSSNQFRETSFQITLCSVLFMGSYWFISRSLTF